MAEKVRHRALIIAGSDSSGGAGIQADIKTMVTNGVYAMSAITALTAQNTTGVTGILEVPADFLEQQLDAVFTDIVPEAVKIGMVSSGSLIHSIARKLSFYHGNNVVIDPVMVATSGARLMEDGALQTLKSELFPLATLLTPNIPEAELLTECKIENKEKMQQAAKQIGDTYHCAVLVKGGHLKDGASDVLYENGEWNWFAGKHVSNPNTHGTGCTLSSAIAANLAKGVPLKDAIAMAKEYLTHALEAMLDLGRGSGPMDHGYMFEK